MIGIDLFCGAGGLSLGFERAGFRVAAAIDDDPLNTAAYTQNFPHAHVLTADVRSLTGDDIRAKTAIDGSRIDVVFGGPPCQGFSIGGHRDDSDPRNSLILEFARLTAELRPRYFVLENVPGILRNDGRLLEPFLGAVAKAGYDVIDPIRELDAQHFGVPQRRRRVFVLGWLRDEEPLRYPSPQKGDAPTTWDALSDLPDIARHRRLLANDVYTGPLGPPSEFATRLRRAPIRAGENVFEISGCLRTVHSRRTRARFASTPPGEREPVSRFFRLDKSAVAPTLRAGSGMDFGSFTAPRPIHPVHPRCITVREAARLQSFPDAFSFHPTKWHGFRQVGNAVPPRLAAAVARSIAAVRRQRISA